jgi:hypothetical protein
MNVDMNSPKKRQDPRPGAVASPTAKRRSGWLLLLAILVVIVALVVQMCTPATYRWKEEVRLHDGRLIVVERSRVMSGPREPFRSATVGKWTLAFENPNKPGKKISLDVHGGADPMLLGFVQGIPYVAIQPGRGDARYFYNCPDPPYIFFRYDGEWRRIELAEFPRELVARNLPNDTPEYEARSRKWGIITSLEMQKLLEIVKRENSVRIIRPNGDVTIYDCNRPGALHAGGVAQPTVAPKAKAPNAPGTEPIRIKDNGRK